MSEFNKMAALPDEMLESIVGGTLNEYSLDQVRTISQQLKRTGYPFKNAMAWWHEQAAGHRFNDEEWQQIEDAVRSVYEE